MHDEPQQQQPDPQPEFSAALDAAPAAAGLVMSWAADLDLADVLAAMRLRERRLAGQDIPGWDEPDPADPAAQSAAGPAGPAGVPLAGEVLADDRRGGDALAGDLLAGDLLAGDLLAGDGRGGDALSGDVPGGDLLAGDGMAGGAPLGDVLDGDVLGEEAVEAALSGAGRVVSLPGLAGYARMAPGPALAGWLDSAPQHALDDAGLVGSIGGWRKITSWAQARELAAVAELARRRGVAGAGGPDGGEPGAGDMPGLDGGLFDRREAEFVPNEIALALTLTQASAQWWMDLAVSLARRLPATLAALRAGTIDLPRARLVDQHTAVLDDELARKVEDRVLAKAGKQTTGQLRAALQRAVISVDPAAAERRREEAEKCARVELSGEETGTASLGGRFLPVAHAAAAWARISAMAKAMQSSGAGGGMDLLRAQVFVGLLLGTLPLIPPPADGPGDGPGPADPGPADPGPADGTGGPAPGDDPAGPGGAPGSGDGPGSGPAGRRAPRGRTRRGGPGDGCRDDHGGSRGGPRRDSGNPDPGGGPRDRDSGNPEDGDRGDAGGCDSGRGEDSNPWLGRPAPREQDAPPDDDDHDQANPGDLGTPHGDDPLDQHFGRPPPPWPGIPGPGEPTAPGCAPGWPGGTPPASGGKQDARQAGIGTTPVAGTAALSVPWRTLAGLCEEPGLLSRIGPVTAQAARDLTAAALADPACVWKIIITDPSGQVVAVTRMRRPRTRAHAGAALAGRNGTAGGDGLIRQVTLTIPLTIATGLAAPPPAVTLGADHPGTGAVGAARPGTATPGADRAGTGALGTGALGTGALGGMLEAALRAARRAAERAAPAATDSSGPCAHQDSVPGYRLSGRLRDLIDARDQGCRNPICRQPASKCDADHTIPWDKGGLTCSCDLSDECRRHHKLKQLRRWQLRQPRPGHLIWATPARLTYASTPPPHPA